MFGKTIVLLAQILLVLWGGPALAGPGASTPEGKVTLLSAVSAVGEATELPLGLHFRLEPGWKVYWRSPGDAGYPPSIDWAGSANLAGAAIAWPLPTRFAVLGLESIGYEKEVVLPLSVRPERPGEPVSLKAVVDYLACAEICVPRRAELDLALPAGPAAPTPAAHLIDRFQAAVPGDGGRAGLSVERVVTSGEGAGAALAVTVRADPPLARPDLFVEAAAGAMFQAPETRLEDGGRRAVLVARAVPGTFEGAIAGRLVTVTVGEAGRAVEAAVTAQAGTVPAALSAAPVLEPPSLLAMLGAALLGGLILNLMPCVLPVLSLKLLALIGHGGAERWRVRAGFVASAAGIVLSFLVLAAVALGLKAAGAAVGWGIQFQQPLFLVAMVVVVSLFAANLWGLFEIPLPGFLSGLGRGGGDPHSPAGHFAAGAFATLLATPCTAPFLGTAVGFALARGAVEILAVFLALGLGMAAPYLAVAAFPGLARRLPRPGAWMIAVRRVMALALGATALWLLAVLTAQMGPSAALAVGGLMGLAIVVLAARARLGDGARRLAGGAVALLALAAFAVPLAARPPAPEAAAPAEPGAIAWVPFDRAAIPRLVAEGRVVFVDVTADWCITCKVNKAAVVDRDPVAERLKQPRLVAMRADWTRPDDGIAAYLRSFGRYGIPFNAVYGPATPEGVALPELLTPGAVIEALDKAGA